MKKADIQRTAYDSHWGRRIPDRVPCTKPTAMRPNTSALTGGTDGPAIKRKHRLEYSRKILAQTEERITTRTTITTPVSYPGMHMWSVYFDGTSLAVIRRKKISSSLLRWRKRMGNISGG